MATKTPFVVKHGLEISGNTEITGSILPSSNNLFDIGSEEMVWGSVYITSITGSADIQMTAGGNIELKSPVQIETGNRITDSAGTKVEFGNNIEMNSNKIIGVGTPTNTTDVSSKGYVDGEISTLNSAISASLSTQSADISSVESDIAQAFTDIQTTNTAVRAYVDTEVANLVDTAPAALDTLNELAAALGDDANFATTVATDIGTKANKSVNITAGSGLSGGGTLESDRTISINSDQRGVITQFGQDTNDYISVNATSIDFHLDGNLDMRLESDGDLHVDGDVVAFSSTTSDERLKEDISVVEGAVDKIKALRGVEFTYKADGKRSAGVIAQEVEEVLPQAVSEKVLPLQAGEDDKTEYKVVQYDQLSSIFIEAIKEQQKMIEDLQSKVEELSK